MTESGYPIRSLKAQSSKTKLERNEYREALEQIANILSNESAPRSRPELTEWKVQRVHTISTLNEFREKIESLCVKPNSEKAVGNTVQTEGATGSANSTLTSSLCAIGNELSRRLITNIGKIVQSTGTSIGGVPNAVESHISEKYLRKIEAVLEEDRTLSRPLARWMNFSKEVEAKFQAIFRVNFTTEKFTSVIKIFQDIVELYHSPNNFDDITGLMESTGIRTYVEVEKLEKFYHCLSNSEFSDSVRDILSFLSAKLKDIHIFVEGVRAYDSIMEISDTFVASTSRNNLNPEVQTRREASVFAALKSIRLGLNVISLINPASIIRHGTSKYSEALNQLTHALAWELERMENL